MNLTFVECAWGVCGERFLKTRKGFGISVGHIGPGCLWCWTGRRHLGASGNRSFHLWWFTYCSWRFWRLNYYLYPLYGHSHLSSALADLAASVASAAPDVVELFGAAVRGSCCLAAFGARVGPWGLIYTRFHLFYHYRARESIEACWSQHSAYDSVCWTGRRPEPRRWCWYRVDFQLSAKGNC